ncbi:MAG TPA: 4a-hydroxytetrahydrobiopterin dehydratase [Acidimicrobiia bacterium]|nr:4a-hydroxytetrahydrobiopterin dehydratase [Acidimicrobiia bacterium]
MALLAPDELARFAGSHPHWEVDDASIVRSFRFTNFVEAMGFVTRVALLAEKADHHPDIDIRWNVVTLRLSTHSAGGLTSKDLDLATQIEN